MSEFDKDDSILLADEAINAVRNGCRAFCKFLSANDTGETGGHQSGIYIPKSSWSILFDQKGVKGSNMKKENVSIVWQNDMETKSSFTYYGCGTRNEYRITRFGKGFGLLNPDYTGALFVLVQNKESDYSAFVLNHDAEIDYFLQTFSLTPVTTNALISYSPNPKILKEKEFLSFINGLTSEFPDSRIMSEAARNIEEKVADHIEYIKTNPDQKLINWVNMEYELFKAIEEYRYLPVIQKGFSDINSFITKAQTILNRRKSRAGKSFEHHLSAIFKGNNLLFEEQVVTEGNKMPDFIFPSAKAYHNPNFPTDRLLSLAAKTTCKDRWRQILNEADRLRNGTKFLCTLQRGISPKQLTEMLHEKVVLVVPKPYIVEYPSQFRDNIWSLRKFIGYVKQIET